MLGRAQEIATGVMVLGALMLVGCVPTSPPPSFNVAVTATASPLNVQPGGTVHFRDVVHNQGPDTAGEVGLIDTLPKFTTFVSVTSSVGGCSTPDADRRISCIIGSLPKGGKAVITIVVVAPTAIGARLVNTAASQTVPADTKFSDNTVTAVSTVQPPG